MKAVSKIGSEVTAGPTVIHSGPPGLPASGGCANRAVGKGGYKQCLAPPHTPGDGRSLLLKATANHLLMEEVSVQQINPGYS